MSPTECELRAVIALLFEILPIVERVGGRDSVLIEKCIDSLWSRASATAPADRSDLRRSELLWMVGQILRALKLGSEPFDRRSDKISARQAKRFSVPA
jgi:hypothetical protein